MTQSAAKPGDPDRLPQQTAKEWIDANGAAGPINAPAAWRERLGLRRPRRGRRTPQGEQLSIETAIAEVTVERKELDPTFVVLVDEAAEILGLSRAGKTSAELLHEVLRAGRADGKTAIAEAAWRDVTRYTLVADVSQFGVDPRPIGDTPGADKESISDCGTIGPVPSSSSTTEEC